MDKKQLAAMVDHTILKPEATLAQVEETIRYAGEIGAASVCLNPCHISLAAGMLRGTSTAVCTVIGFPLGANTSHTKAKETANAWLHGATEIDMVINIGALKSGDLQFVKQDIECVVNASPALVKVILETGFLTEAEIKTACQLCEEAGAHYVKTSTGFGPRGASVEDVRLMRASVSDHIKVKAAGGIGTLADVKALIEAGADRLGMSRTAHVLEELDKENAG